MTVKTGIIFITLVIGALAIPKPKSDDDFAQFFEHVDPESRIVGGTVTADGSDPHMVALTSGLIINSFVCGGSIIGARSVLTAAHCIDAVYSLGSLSRTLRVTVGTNRWNRGGETFSLSGNATHANYVSKIIKNDLGILYTSLPIVYKSIIQPIALSYDHIEGGVAVRATGWGRIRANGALSSQLLELRMSTISGDQCVADVIQMDQILNMNAPPVEPHIELCTKHNSGEGFGMCNGDSGSALLRIEDRAQVGIVSWGFPCARGAPDMFVRISAYEDWLAERIRN